ncbi:MAG: hypothetical protein KDD34_06365 [Bdellovibrionales bacterium]|nr:hypothetical protein [Bdellovibrionales bacterium]
MKFSYLRPGFTQSLLFLMTVGMIAPVIRSFAEEGGGPITFEIYRRNGDHGGDRDRGGHRGGGDRDRGGNRGGGDRDRGGHRGGGDRDRGGGDRDRGGHRGGGDRDRVGRPPRGPNPPRPPRRTQPRPPRRDHDRDRWRDRRPVPPYPPRRPYPPNPYPPRRPYPRPVPPRTDCSWNPQALSCSILGFRWQRPHEGFQISFNGGVSTNYATQIALQSVFTRGKQGRVGTAGLSQLIVEYSTGEREDLVPLAMRLYPHRISNKGRLYLAYDGDKFVLPLRPHRYIMRVFITADSWIDPATEAYLAVMLER